MTCLKVPGYATTLLHDTFGAEVAVPYETKMEAGGFAGCE